MRPTVGCGKCTGMTNVPVPATSPRNFRRDRAASSLSQSKIVDQSGSRHCSAWCMRSPTTTARCPPERILTQQWQGECPGVGVSQNVSSSAKSSSTSSACPAATTGSQLNRKTLGAGGIVAGPGRLLPGAVFALVKDVFRLREGRHPAPVAQLRVPAGMVDVQVGAEHVVDVLEPQAGGVEAVEPGLLRKVHWRRMA